MKRREGKVAILVSTVSALTLVGCGGSLEVPSGEGVGDAEAGEIEAAEARRWEPCSLEAERVKDLRRGPASSAPEELTHGDGTLLFAAEDGASGRELWKSSGTQGEGTKRVKDLRPGPLGSEPASFTRVGDTVFFTADDGMSGRELWKTDGTRSGTKRVKDIYPGPTGSTPEALIEFDGVLYFAADDGTHGREPWRSDGTTAGTVALEDIAPGAAASDPRDFVRSGWDVFFSAENAFRGRELWALPFRPEGRCAATAFHALSTRSAGSPPARCWSGAPVTGAMTWGPPRCRAARSGRASPARRPPGEDRGHLPLHRGAPA